jgi:rRNA maturation endonuclease Nob1
MARKKKVVTPVIESPEETVVEAPFVQKAPSPKQLTYKCIECGQENEVKKCKRCGSSLVREV